MNKKIVFSVLLLLFGFQSHAAILMECRGRSQLHRIEGTSEDDLVYSNRGFAGGSPHSQFPVERLFVSGEPNKYIFRNLDHKFAISTLITEARRTVNGAEIATGTGAMYRKDGFTSDQIQTCWINTTVLAPL